MAPPSKASGTASMILEVWACPCSCVNEGGQIKAPAGVSSAAHIKQLALLYFWTERAGSGTAAAAAAAAAGRHQQRNKSSSTAYITRCHSAAQCARHGPSLLLHFPGNQSGSSSSTNGSSFGAAASWSWAVPGTADPASLAAVYDVLVGGSPGAEAAAHALPSGGEDAHKHERRLVACHLDNVSAGVQRSSICSLLAHSLVPSDCSLAVCR
jgi:hypothetical protein